MGLADVAFEVVKLCSKEVWVQGAGAEGVSFSFTAVHGGGSTFGEPSVCERAHIHTARLEALLAATRDSSRLHSTGAEWLCAVVAICRGSAAPRSFASRIIVVSRRL